MFPYLSNYKKISSDDTTSFASIEEVVSSVNLKGLGPYSLSSALLHKHMIVKIILPMPPNIIRNRAVPDVPISCNLRIKTQILGMAIANKVIESGKLIIPAIVSLSLDMAIVNGRIHTAITNHVNSLNHQYSALVARPETVKYFLKQILIAVENDIIVV